MSLYESGSIPYSIAPQCPWYEQQQAYGTPNVDWCEPTICAWINEPANTWSNLGFILVGLYLYKKYSSTPLLKNFGLIVFIMGLFSGIYHATNNYFSQHLDFFGMSLFVSYVLAFQWLRAKNLKLASLHAYFWFFMSVNLILLISLAFLKLPIQSLLLINTIPIILLEAFVFAIRKRRSPLRFFAISLFLLILAQVSAQIDLKRIYCDPQNVWLHGHVIWHLLCAVAMYFIAQHLRARANS